MLGAMTLNDKAEENDPKRQKGGKMVTPNAKLDNGFECQNEDTTLNAKLKKMVVLNAKLKTCLWTPKTDESGFEW